MAQAARHWMRFMFIGAFVMISGPAPAEENLPPRLLTIKRMAIALEQMTPEQRAALTGRAPAAAKPVEPEDFLGVESEAPDAELEAEETRIAGHYDGLKFGNFLRRQVARELRGAFSQEAQDLRSRLTQSRGSHVAGEIGVALERTQEGDGPERAALIGLALEVHNEAGEAAADALRPVLRKTAAWPADVEGRNTGLGTLPLSALTGYLELEKDPKLRVQAIQSALKNYRTAEVRGRIKKLLQPR